MNKKLVMEGITALLILLFLYTALSKLLDLHSIAVTFSTSRYSYLNLPFQKHPEMP